MTAKIKLNAASGGGSFSLQAPSSSANNRVFTLPDSTDATLLTSTASLGKILQVVEGSTTTAVSTTSAGYLDTGLSQAITPLQTGSQILVIVSQHVGFQRYSTSNGASLKLFQDSTVLYDPPQLYENYLYVGGSFMSLKLRAHLTFKHAHGKTAGTSTTYKTQGAMQQSANTPTLYFQGNDMRSSIVLMEIAA